MIQYEINSSFFVTRTGEQPYHTLPSDDMLTKKNKVKSVHEADKIPSKLSHIPFSNFKLLLLPDYLLVHQINK